MAVYRTYKCPECEKCFDFLHHPNDEPPPSFCPLCGANVSGEKKRRKRAQQVDRVQSPYVGPPRSGRTGIATKSVDGLYRGMEDAATGRMQDAADLLGVDVRSLGHMKMTDMKDNLRAGDMSHVPAAAAKIQGTMTDLVRTDTNTPLGASFGMQGAAPPLPGAPTTEMKGIMASTFANHTNRVQATVAAGIKK